jgi:hypothetical protein
MITLLVNPPAASAQWSDLAHELDRWVQEGRIATLWWRDDDASAPSGRLGSLLAIAGRIPLALAVIPALAGRALAAQLDRTDHSRVRILQHGWRHFDHSADGKKSEFPPSRSTVEIASDLAEGRARLSGLFGAGALPVLVPPWNRFAEGLLPLLACAGITAISRVKPRALAWPAADVFAANVHVDLVAWRGNRGFVGETAALSGLTGHLRARRRGTVDPVEPTGILTHHLIQDAATEIFLVRLFQLTCGHPAARWLDASEVFARCFAGLGAAGAV